MKITDIRTECSDGIEKTRSLEEIQIIAVHRIWLDDIALGDTLHPKTICRLFIHDKRFRKYTGGAVPYPLFVAQDGAIYQTQEIRDATPHARRWNYSALGVAVVGDFRKRPPSPSQRSALVDLCAALCLAFDLDPLGDTEIPSTVKAGQGQYIRGGALVKSLCGHDELPGGSSDPDKKCPGEFLPMGQLRQDVTAIIQREAWGRLASSGLAV